MSLEQHLLRISPLNQRVLCITLSSNDVCRLGHRQQTYQNQDDL